MQGKTYAVVASRIDDAVQIINITNPSDPRPVSSVFNGRGGFDALHFATGVDITTVQGKTYAVVTSRDDDAVQIIDITALPSPKPVSSVFDGQGGFSALDFALDVEIVDISGKTYAVVASRNDDGIQIIDITNPSSPKPVSSAVDGRGGFNALDGSREVDILVMSNMTYAVVAAVNDDAIQIINITIPSNPKPVSSVFDGRGGFDALDGAEDVDTVTISGKTYAVVAALYDDAVQIINITNPSDPKPVSSAFDGQGGFDALDGARDVDILAMSNRVYAVVTAGYTGDYGIQIIDITNPSDPKPAASVFDGRGGFDALYGADDADIVSISGKTYVVAASHVDHAIQIINITNPSDPKPVSSAFDGRDGFDALSGAWDLDITTMQGKTYVVVASRIDDAVQIINITNPLRPKAGLQRL